MRRRPKSIQPTLWDELKAVTQRNVPSLRDRYVQRDSLRTGIPQLDTQLHAGGLPKGRITEIVGELSSGCTSLAANIIATAQREIGFVSYMRFASALDPLYAMYVGVQIEQLFFIELEHCNQVVGAVHDALAFNLTSLLVVDLMDCAKPIPGELVWPMDKDGASTVVVLRPRTYADTLGESAWVRIQLDRKEWIYEDGDIIGTHSHATLVKNKPAHGGQAIDLSFSYPRFKVYL